MTEANDSGNTDKHLKIAFTLGLITIFYNIIEGLVSTWFGWEDQTLALLGFGVDSYVEVISGIGVVHMVIRMKKEKDIAMRDRFEDTALRITGVAFYLLCASLVAGAGITFYLGSHPQTTVAGIIVSGISIATMYYLYKAKLKVGKSMNSAPILSDAECTKTCYQLSFVLLGSSLAYELAMVPFIDAIGGLGIAWFAYQGGKEAFEKIRTKSFSCDTDQAESG
jgi:divalent metal cation (Fe/Co/Zn/Cd) transporter